MASSQCLRCLSRPSAAQFQSSAPLVLLPRGFSTTASARANARSQAPAEKGKAKTYSVKKKAPPKKAGKPPASGERKMLRKRVVLSNTNAFEVAELQDMDAAVVDTMVGLAVDGGEEALAVEAQGEKEEKGYVGKVVGLLGSTVDSLRAVDAFKTTQGWQLFRRPAIVVREESVAVSKKLVEAEKNKSTLRMVVDGERGTGKSLMLVHAMATAFVKGWVVINIPEAQEVTNAVTEYAPLPGTTPTLWAQPNYTASLLTQIAKANSAVLDHLKITKEHNLPVPLQSNISLTRLCELGARDPDVAWPFFQAFLKEITAEGRPPVLMCLDSLSFIMQNSLYRAQDYSPVHSHDLAIVRCFVDHLSGAASLPNGGAVIAATSKSHAPISISTNLAMKQGEERAAGKEITPKDPYEKRYDARVDQVLSSVDVLRLGGISKDEARGLMEYWARSGVLRDTVNEKSVSEKWALAGNGVVGEIQRGALWMRI